MNQIQKLLTVGQSILAAKDEAVERAAQAENEKLSNSFAIGRAEALKLFDPIGGEVLVTPTGPADGWNPLYDGGKVTFRVRPFGEQAGAICVRLLARIKYGGEDRGIVWIREDDRFSYYVESRWVWASDSDDVWCDMFETVNLLPEAVALCHRLGETYRESQRRFEQAKAARESDRKSERARSKTPAEKLIAALTEFCEAAAIES